MALYGKKCGCGFQFAQHGKPHKDAAGKCPDCGEIVKLGDAKELPEAPEPPKEAK